MKIEKEIQQTTSFISEFQKAAVNILYTASWLERRHTENLQPYDLTPQQFNILRILRGCYPAPATINTLIERMIDKSSNVSRLVDRLVKKGFVQRTENKSDKRSVNVLISEKGLAVLKQIDVDNDILESWLHTITKSEATELNRILDKLRG
jgi:DNA-binding MarR family transcriptional regulator